MNENLTDAETGSRAENKNLVICINPKTKPLQEYSTPAKSLCRFHCHRME